jgi:RNA polymerase sigma factor (TIGR02999 family)
MPDKRLPASPAGSAQGKARVSDTDITSLLALARDGEPAQLGAVFEALYPELLRLANSRLYGNEATLTPTVLVHELFLRITQGKPLSLTDRNHFFAISAQAMRWILVEHARQRVTEKRGGGQVMISLDDQIPQMPVATTNVLALEECLQALEAISPQRRRIVELRYFAGLEFAEIARLLACSERTVYREWERARAFLQAMLNEAGDGR